jgi:D-3-phosphoglycerate dehydrogenase
MASRSLAQGWLFARGLDGDDAALHTAVESGKKAFAGIELAGRTLGVIGLGAIGGRVAGAGVALGMHVVGFDPSLSVDAAWHLDSRVAHARTIDEVFRLSDYVSVHVPLGTATRGLVNAERLGLMKDGAVIVNFAREGVVDEGALLEALETGRLRAYVSDFPTAATVRHPRCVTLPHLGASTAEAEDNCAVMVADQVRDFLDRGDVRNSVNFPPVVGASTFAHRVVVAGAAGAQILPAVTAAIDMAAIALSATVSATRGDLAYGLIDTAAPIPAALVETLRGIEGVASVRVIA